MADDSWNSSGRSRNNSVAGLQLRAGTKPVSLQRMRPLLGTFCVVQASGPRAVVETAIAAAFAELKRIENLMHPSRAGSDLQRLNAQRAVSVKIDPSTMEVLALAAQLHLLSNGVFDPCLPKCTGRFSDIELCTDNVVIAHREVAVDLGGVAKGYAVDRAVHVLRARGCNAGMVNGGGDLRVFGSSAKPIALRLSGSESRTVTLQDRALAASDALSMQKPVEFMGYYSRGRGDTLLRQRAVVVAMSAAVADALTKCAMLCDEAQRRAVFRALDAEIVSLDPP
jgi:FAD:protein FMN transferase